MLDLIGSPAFLDVVVWLGHYFKTVTLPYLLLIRRIQQYLSNNKAIDSSNHLFAVLLQSWQLH
jgi:hypothetical protein